MGLALSSTLRLLVLRVLLIVTLVKVLSTLFLFLLLFLHNFEFIIYLFFIYWLRSFQILTLSLWGSLSLDITCRLGLMMLPGCLLLLSKYSLSCSILSHLLLLLLSWCRPLRCSSESTLALIASSSLLLLLSFLGVTLRAVIIGFFIAALLEVRILVVWLLRKLEWILFKVDWLDIVWGDDSVVWLLLHFAPKSSWSSLHLNVMFQ